MACPDVIMYMYSTCQLPVAVRVGVIRVQTDTWRNLKASAAAIACKGKGRIEGGSVRDGKEKREAKRERKAQEETGEKG